MAGPGLWMLMLEISPEKVAFVIVRSRGITDPMDTSDMETTMDRDDAGPESVLFDSPSDFTGQELRGFLNGLNEDELASLIAVAWIGRETYAPEELNEAMAVAKAEHRNNPIAYLMSLPLLPDYLADGMEALGISTEALEGEVSGFDPKEMGDAYAEDGETT
jgi:hypothetical protein